MPKNNDINYKITEVEKKEQFNKLYSESVLTLEGFLMDNNNIKAYLNYLKDRGFLRNNKEIEIFHIKAKAMNDTYNLMGNNAYPDDLNIVCISLNDLKNIGRLAIDKFSFEGRWFNDIVDNNIARNNTDIIWLIY